ncbi:MAG: gamma-glutamylcyclotransferase [Pseudomonadota bacterium]
MMSLTPFDEARWVFGYASLIWRPDFEYREQSVARLDGFRRVLWQGSPDHRGTPDAPGRVATLTRDASATCGGMAFRLVDATRRATLRALDDREQGGYAREMVDVTLADGRRVPALTYIGWPDNPHFLGPASEHDIVDHVRRSHGPSGPNTDYVVNLARALDDLAMPDPVLARLARQLA